MSGFDLDLGDEQSYKIKLGPKSYEVREPSVEDVRLMNEEIESGIDNLESLMNFLDKLGVPKADTSSMGISKLNRLSDFLIQGMSEKK